MKSSERDCCKITLFEVFLEVIARKTVEYSNVFEDLGAGAFDILVTDDNGCTGTINTMLNAPIWCVHEIGASLYRQRVRAR